MGEEVSFSALLRRIHKFRLRHEGSKLFKEVKAELVFMGCIIFIAFHCRCFNRIYNSWKGPFPMDLDQFRDHLKINYQILDSKSELSLYLSVFQPEYIQLQLGRNIFGRCSTASFPFSEDNMLYGKTNFTVNIILDTYFPELNKTLYVLYLADEQMQYERRLPIHFESFRLETFQCLVDQLDLSWNLFDLWFEQSIHIDKIQQIYDDDPKRFNEKVIKPCGIILGYLSRPPNEYPGISDTQKKQNQTLVTLNAQPHYTTDASHIVAIILIALVLRFVNIIVCAALSALQTFHSRIPQSFKEQMKKMNIVSLEQFDQLLSKTTYENNYQDRLFIILKKYLILLRIDFNETSEKILQDFFSDSPVVIFLIDNIIEVQSDRIVYQNENDDQIIPFPQNVETINFNPTEWLHKRLIDLSDQYRNNWELNKELYAEREQHQRLLQRAIAEETEYQSNHHRNRIGQFLFNTIPASARFIAEFRLSGWKVVDSNLQGKTCSICLDNLRLNQGYSQWPCPAKHTFHYDCLLNAFRTGNQCPLCRHPVEAAYIFNINTNTFIYPFFTRWIPNQTSR